MTYYCHDTKLNIRNTYQKKPSFHLDLSSLCLVWSPPSFLFMVALRSCSVFQTASTKSFPLLASLSWLPRFPGCVLPTSSLPQCRQIFFDEFLIGNALNYLSSLSKWLRWAVGCSGHGAAAMLQARPNVYATSANLCSLAPLMEKHKPPLSQPDIFLVCFPFSPKLLILYALNIWPAFIWTLLCPT